MPALAFARQNKWEDLLTKLAVLVSILMIVGGAIGMILVQEDLRKSQDLRQQASVAQGQVEVTTSAGDFTLQQPGLINFSINTHGVQTDGVQLTFNVVTNTVNETPVFSLKSGVPLQIAYSEIETTADGYLVSIIAIPSTIGQSFSTTTSTPFAQLSLLPVRAGQITLNFDVENSISTIHASNPPQDELKHIATANFPVAGGGGTAACQTDADCGAGQTCYQPPMPECPSGMACIQVMPPKVCQAIAVSPSPSASPATSASPAVSPSASPVVSPGVSPSPSASANPSATPAISPSPTSNLGGNSVSTCNESCSSNADCDVNLRCYSGQCRLVTNVTSPTCAVAPDRGLSFQCNEYCADTRECASGLTCQNNRCRNPENLESATCAALTVAQRSSLVRSCNESCSSNADCDVNLRCYQGACRLATNPGSFSCSASTSKTVSTSVYGTKGSDTAVGSTGSTGSTSAGSASGSKSGSTGSKTGAGALDTGSTKTTASSSTGKTKIEEKTALDAVKNYFLANPQLPLIIIGLGLGLILILVLLAILKRVSRRRPPTPPTSGLGNGTSGNLSGNGSSFASPAKTSASAAKVAPAYENDLQSKINALKNQSAAGTPAMTETNLVKPPVAESPAPTAPLAPTTPTTTPAVSSSPTEIFAASGQSSSQIGQDPTPISGQTAPASAPGSANSEPQSMLERLKSRNVTPPAV